MVAHLLPKQVVAGSSPVSRSTFQPVAGVVFNCCTIRHPYAASHLSRCCQHSPLFSGSISGYPRFLFRQHLKRICAKYVSVDKFLNRG